MSIAEDLKYIGCRVDELEMQNLRLQSLVDSLTEQLENQAVDEKVVRFLDLVEKDIERNETLKLDEGDRRIEIIAAFREIRPK